VKACMQCLSNFGIVHHGGRSVAESGPVESDISGVMGLFVCMTK
jgi:hypothetical protein